MRYLIFPVGYKIASTNIDNVAKARAEVEFLFGLYDGLQSPQGGPYLRTVA